MPAPELPDVARAWAAARSPYPIVGVDQVGGGITNTKWLLRLANDDHLVIRWADPQVWGETGREHVRREAMALRLLADSELPVSRLVATDPNGADAGGPANLLGWQAGATRLSPLGPVAIDELARIAVAVHRVPVPEAERPPVFDYRGPAHPEVPGWTGRPELWRHAIALGKTGAPPTPYGLLHRDFHFGNLLWEGDQISGLIDWAELSWGPPDLDVAHLCSDFAMLHDVGEAEAFRTAYVAQGGRLDPDPDAARFWMISDILGFLPDPAHILPGVTRSRPDLTADRVRLGLENLLAHTLA